MYQEIYVIEDNNEIGSKVKKVLKDEKDFSVKIIETSSIEDELKNIPDLIIINEDGINKNLIELCKLIRSNDNSITPIIVISSDISKKHRVEILKNSVEYFIKAPIDSEYMYYTIKNILRLIQMNRRVSPLTGLPGNVQIQVEIKKRLLRKKPFAVFYFDLDNFKEYNDIYGFLKGDEIIKYTAKTIIKVIHKYELESTFVGHIGGDDFIAIIPESDYDAICQDVLANFDHGIEKFFTEDDWEKGYLEVANRKGIIERFPLTSLSIGVVAAEVEEYVNSLEIGEVGAQVKHLAKTQVGSAYAINRRKK